MTPNKQQPQPDQASNLNSPNFGKRPMPPGVPPTSTNQMMYPPHQPGMPQYHHSPYPPSHHYRPPPPPNANMPPPFNYNDPNNQWNDRKLI